MKKYTNFVTKYKINNETKNVDMSEAGPPKKFNVKTHQKKADI